MNGTVMELRVAGLVLGQGRRVHHFSMGLAALVALWVMLAPPSVHAMAAWKGALLLASVLAAVAQAWCAIRVDLDAGLFEAAAGLPADRATDDLDAALAGLGLQPAARVGRSWAARWRGARRWLRRQVVLAALQLLLVAVACAPVGLP